MAGQVNDGLAVDLGAWLVDPVDRSIRRHVGKLHTRLIMPTETGDTIELEGARWRGARNGTPVVCMVYAATPEERDRAGRLVIETAPAPPCTYVDLDAFRRRWSQL